MYLYDEYSYVFQFLAYLCHIFCVCTGVYLRIRTEIRTRTIVFVASNVKEQIVVRAVQREVIRYKTVRRTDRNKCRADVYQHISFVSNEWRTTLNNTRYYKLFQYFVAGMGFGLNRLITLPCIK